MWMLFALVACGPKPASPEVLSQRQATGTVAQTGALTPAEQRALAENFARVHFPLDSAVLDASAKAALADNARILRDHLDVRVEVQGHADDRGTVDYNLALGQRRGKAVVDALVASGVSPARLALISFGEERPRASGAGEVAWAENRRAEFRVLTGGPALHGTID
jgi:peptidoglycan-associated lipoprotein